VFVKMENVSASKDSQDKDVIWKNAKITVIIEDSVSMEIANATKVGAEKTVLFDLLWMEML
jgi:hypothetical protein